MNKTEFQLPTMDEQNPTMDQQNNLTDVRAGAEKVLVLRLMVSMYVMFNIFQVTQVNSCLDDCGLFTSLINGIQSKTGVKRIYIAFG